MLSVLEIETRSLQLCLAQLNEVTLIDKEQINGENDASVVRFNYVMRQYDLLSTQEKTFIRKYTARFKFIVGLKAIEKRRRRF